MALWLQAQAISRLYGCVGGCGRLWLWSAALIEAICGKMFELGRIRKTMQTSPHRKKVLSTLCKRHHIVEAHNWPVCFQLQCAEQSMKRGRGITSARGLTGAGS